MFAEMARIKDQVETKNQHGNVFAIAETKLWLILAILKMRTLYLVDACKKKTGRYRTEKHSTGLTEILRISKLMMGLNFSLILVTLIWFCNTDGTQTVVDTFQQNMEYKYTDF